MWPSVTSVNRDYDIRVSVLPGRSARLNNDRFNMVCRFNEQETSPEGRQKDCSRKRSYTHGKGEEEEEERARVFRRVRTKAIGIAKLSVCVFSIARRTHSRKLYLEQRDYCAIRGAIFIVEADY